jgi:hypothetical protein
MMRPDCSLRRDAGHKCKAEKKTRMHAITEAFVLDGMADK